MTGRQYKRFAGLFGSSIRGIARKLSKQDEELFADLVQVGHIALWQVEPNRARRNTDAYIRQSVKFRMVDHLRRMDPDRYVSLDDVLDGRHSLERDEVAGGLCLVSTGCKGDHRRWANQWAWEPQPQPRKEPSGW